MKKRFLIAPLLVVIAHFIFRAIRFNIPAFLPGQGSDWMGTLLGAAAHETRIAFALGAGNEWAGMVVLALIAAGLTGVLSGLWRWRKKITSSVLSFRVSRKLQFRLFLGTGLVMLSVLTYLIVFWWVGRMRSTAFIVVCLTLSVGLLVGLIYGVAWFEKRDRRNSPRT